MQCCVLSDVKWSYEMELEEMVDTLQGNETYKLRFVAFVVILHILFSTFKIPHIYSKIRSWMDKKARY